ncbi:RapZ C-terminal domain-containing protein [Parafilimonas terrae]|jgi:aminoglycoside/choline kinase family phosphotransferase|uniref:Phosphotransferase enzyme family protein n=1 Tax=Parafilimonas terrae TaxID=1465490 RepID=A0A1I5X3N6_9BACT|nr:RNase adapter RapZ [Parafilimonas terrae]SFQ26287.1 Phosphotransferase enzyme family protein [Parafilimonas terrae]
MKIIIDKVQELCETRIKQSPERIEQLPRSGSDRIYFRIFYSDKTYIATYNLNIKENKTFIAFSEHFRNKQLPVPEIYFVNEDITIYIQEDLGTVCLLDILEKDGFSNYVFDLYKESLKQLAHLQIAGDKNLDYDICLTAKEFGKQAILSDLLYFKYYFLDTLQLPYDKQAMLDDFEALATYLTKTEYKYFMFRDFQSRNIIINNDEVHFIDFQGGMKGALQYDVASLLWQAKANLSDEWKEQLLKYYLDVIDELLLKPIDRQVFVGQYNGYVLIRMLQVLGAYGFRGLFERKAHFLTSIPIALKNLKNFLQNSHVGIITTELSRMLDAITSQEIITNFEPFQADEHTPLVVTINSFSYKKGIPQDESGNGGGFVFDCRGLLNPGRFEEYKTLTGQHKKVTDFLEQRTRMNEFLNGVYDVVDISVEDFIKRGFSNLMINFGCTGGQHRSVYAAEQTAKHLVAKYKVKVLVTHLNECNWVKEISTKQTEIA